MKARLALIAGLIASAVRVSAPAQTPSATSTTRAAESSGPQGLLESDPVTVAATHGHARSVIPTQRWGAPEIAVRYSKLDLDDRAIQGGRLEKWFFGASWWATHHWKLGAGYGLAYLDRFGVRGKTDIWQFRIQTIY